VRTDPSAALLEKRPNRRGHPRLSRPRKWLIGSTLVAYVVVVVGVLTTSWLVRFDWQVMLFRPYKHWPEYQTLLEVVVVLGQRGPTALVVLAYLGWRSLRTKDLRPLLVLGLALLLLNITVGAVKYGVGRLGPHYATSVGSAELFAGGDIFPSGHTANAVVTWGVLAYLATTHRRTGAVITAIFAFTVGMTTIYLGTHWVTDVIAGWMAGVLVMLVLPLLEPLVAWLDLRIQLLWARLRTVRQTVPMPSPIAARSPSVTTSELPAPAVGGLASPARQATAAGAATAGATALVADHRHHHATARVHAPRHDRASVPSAALRRPRPDQRPAHTGPYTPPPQRSA
jgi:membrane-associated phospholipid phosphatase